MIYHIHIGARQDRPVSEEKHADGLYVSRLLLHPHSLAASQGEINLAARTKHLHIC